MDGTTNNWTVKCLIHGSKLIRKSPTVEKKPTDGRDQNTGYAIPPRHCFEFVFPLGTFLRGKSRYFLLRNKFRVYDLLQLACSLTHEVGHNAAHQKMFPPSLSVGLTIVVNNSFT